MLAYASKAQKNTNKIINHMVNLKSKEHYHLKQSLILTVYAFFCFKVFCMFDFVLMFNIYVLSKFEAKFLFETDWWSLITNNRNVSTEVSFMVTATKTIEMSLLRSFNTFIDVTDSSANVNFNSTSKIYESNFQVLLP